MNVRDIALRAAHAFSAEPAVVCAGRTYTFAECWARAIRLANGLLAKGIEPGDHVAVLEKNSIRSVDFYLGAAIAGIVRVPLYWRNSAHAHLAMVTNAECRAGLFDADAGLDVVDTLSAELTYTVTRDEAYEAWLAQQSEVMPQVPLTDSTLCLIRHTGGTTGAPKGITSTHRQWACIGRDVTSFKPRIVAGDAMLHVAPLSHASGYYFLPAWAAGARQVLLPEADPAQIVDSLVHHDIAHFFAPPTLIDMVVSAGANAGVRPTALKSVAIGSSPISRRTLSEARAYFGDDVLYQTYGTSEAVPISGMGPESWLAEVDGSDPSASAGRPLPFADVELRDESGVVVAPGCLGEVVVRCDGMSDGYYRAPELTSERFVDGWFHTGDLGRLDDNGYLYLVDRVGEMIVSGGHNIYPGDLERVASEVDGVLEAAAFGVPDEKWGETPILVCRRRPDAPIASDDLRAAVSGRLGSYMKPSRVVFVDDALPRSAVGKIARRAVRDHYLDDQN